MKNLIVVLFSILIFPARAVDLQFQAPHLGSDKIDIQHYDLKITTTKLEKNINIQARIDIKFTQATKSFGLHLDRQAILIKSITAKEVLNYRIVKGISGNHGLRGDVLKINLNKLLKPQDNISILIKYEVRSNSFHDDKGFMYKKNYNGASILNIRSWPYYTRFWLPSNDHPGDVATFKYELNVPRNMMAVANGDLQAGSYQEGEAILHSGLKKYKYHQKTPIPTYATNLFIGDLKVYNDKICYDLDGLDNKRIDCNFANKEVPLNYFYPKNVNFNAYVSQISKSADALVFYSKLFNNYAFSSLGFVTAPHPFNMESVNLITLVSPDAAVHEVLHQWWGNTVYFKHWGDFWISEGLTTYFTGYYDEYLTGKNTACSQVSGRLNHGPETDPMDIFDRTPYCKGSATIASLRGKIMELAGLEIKSTEGRNLFNHIMKSFYNQYRFKKIDSKEFIQYFQLNLKVLSRNVGIELNQINIDLSISHWSEKWFKF